MGIAEVSVTTCINIGIAISVQKGLERIIIIMMTAPQGQTN